MRSSRYPLLCELHAHTTWSDGDLSLAELVDLYGRSGFDVLCVTDHVGRSEDEWRPPGWRITDAAAFDDYVGAVERQARRARAVYGLVLVPGLELTYDDRDPLRAAHAVAVGLRSFVGVDGGLDQALTDARAGGAALIAAHPYAPSAAGDAPRETARWCAEGRALSQLVDRYELVNRRDFFPWVAEAGLPGPRCSSRSPPPQEPGAARCDRPERTCASAKRGAATGSGRWPTRCFRRASARRCESVSSPTGLIDSTGAG